MSGQAWSQNGYGDWMFSKVRRFIVVREGDLACTAVPVTTYNAQGVAKEGVKKSDHSIVYSGRSVPPLGPGEAPSTASEAPMKPYPVQVDTDQGDKLDPLSRIDYARPQTIQHYVKVKSVGKVNKNSMSRLIGQYRLVSEEGSRPKRKARPSQSTFEGQSIPPPVREPSRSGYQVALDALVACGHTHDEAIQHLKAATRSKQTRAVTSGQLTARGKGEGSFTEIRDQEHSGDDSSDSDSDDRNRTDSYRS